MADSTTTLHGYHYSVYTRAARLALYEKGVEADFVDVDPFSPDLDPAYLELHPFRRVPVLEHAGRVVYETAAITAFVDEAFAGPALQPGHAPGRARMRQVIGVVDAYGYWPMVRQVYSNRVFLPAMGMTADDAAVVRGLDGSRRALAALDRLTGADGILDAGTVTLADLHLAPMLSCFVQAPEGVELLASFPALTRWWDWISQRPSMAATDPGPP